MLSIRLLLSRIDGHSLRPHGWPARASSGAGPVARLRTPLAELSDRFAITTQDVDALTSKLLTYRRVDSSFGWISVA